MCPSYLQTLAALFWEVQDSDFFNYIQQIFRLSKLLFNHLHSIHYFTTANYGILLADATIKMFKVTSFC